LGQKALKSISKNLLGLIYLIQAFQLLKLSILLQAGSNEIFANLESCRRLTRSSFWI